MLRHTYDTLYGPRLTHADQAEGLAGRLARMMLELGALLRAMSPPP